MKNTSRKFTADLLFYFLTVGEKLQKGDQEYYDGIYMDIADTRFGELVEVGDIYIRPVRDDETILIDRTEAIKIIRFQLARHLQRKMAFYQLVQMCTEILKWDDEPKNDKELAEWVWRSTSSVETPMNSFAAVTRMLGELIKKIIQRFENGAPRCVTCGKEMDETEHNYGTEDILTCIHCYNDAQNL